MQGKLQSPAHDLPIHSDTRTSIEVDPLSITASQIAEQVSASAFESSTFNEVYSHIRLS